MKKSLALCVLAFVPSACAQNPAGVRILLGMTDQQATHWDGSLSVRGADLTSLEPWRFEQPDAISGNSWKASSRPARLFGGAIQFDLPSVPVVPNGVIAFLSNSGTGVELDVTTAQGNFTVRLADLQYGKAGSALNGRVAIDLVPVSRQLTNDADEQDQPAAAVAGDGTVWLAYLNFIHHPEHNRLRANFKEAPADFADMKASTGGDQIVARSFSNGAWGAPVEITAAGGDVWRPAVAIDGSGIVWVFWTQNESGNFDIWARPIAGGKPGKAVRLSTEAGVDMDPVAAADSQGRVWVAWQAWRNGRAAIIASSGNQGAFSTGKTVAPSLGNQWNPAIAADGKGHVAVAWDSYENGNYDVFLRVAANGTWGRVTTVAATARYEAYPSIAYDPTGCLWAAYEEGGEGWGKDFGAYSSTGVALYQGRAIRLVGFAPDGRVVKTKQDPGTLLPGPMSIQPSTVSQNASDFWLVDDPARAQQRTPNRPTKNLLAPKNTLPRLTVDSSGRMWLALRSVNPVWWTPLGTVWTEYVMSYAGGAWTAPVYLHHTDNLLDNRPALALLRPGELMVIGSSDYRRHFEFSQRAAPAGAAINDPYNNDLFANTIRLGPGNGAIETVAAEAPAKSAPAGEIKAERDAVARMRAYRLKYGSQTLRLERGEFHRHSEVSGDGGFDGTRLDQWRYVIDAADMDWVGCCDHDNGNGREYTWWTNQKETDLFYAPGRFAPLFSYERSVPYPEGHRNVLFAQRGIRTLPRLPRMQADSTGKAPDTLMLYRYLKEFQGVTSSHTSATGMGTDWRDNDVETETSVEIYQGDRQNYEKPGSPRSSSENDSIGNYRPKGYVNLALEMGYKLSFQASSDHVSTHMSFANVLATANTREALMDAFRQRHVYASTDNILAEFRCGDHIMGDSFSTAQPPVFQVKLTGTRPFAKVVIVKDSQYVYSQEPKSPAVSFTWRDTAAKAGAKPSYYYVRGEQENGDIVWVSPMWISYTGQ